MDDLGTRRGVRLVLASTSPARLATLRRAGLDPEVVVSGAPEDDPGTISVAELVAVLARRKAEAVEGRLRRSAPTVIVGCDSLLELDGIGFGKPRTAAAARERWSAMRGRTGRLHTGHHAILREPGRSATRTATATTVVHFADPSREEIDAYVATGEPLEVAGAFTVDGLGGAFVTGIEGDHHNVVGISLPLLRTMLADLGVTWTDLWRPGASAGAEREDDQDHVQGDDQGDDQPGEGEGHR